MANPSAISTVVGGPAEAASATLPLSQRSRSPRRRWVDLFFLPFLVVVLSALPGQAFLVLLAAYLALECLVGLLLRLERLSATRDPAERERIGGAAWLFASGLLFFASLGVAWVPYTAATPASDVVLLGAVLALGIGLERRVLRRRRDRGRARHTGHGAPAEG